MLQTLGASGWRIKYNHPGPMQLQPLGSNSLNRIGAEGVTLKASISH